MGREERIASLATTLKASGIAKSDAQARMMAEEMIGVEENVQKRFDDEHTKAHEFLSTAKNLGQPRVKTIDKAIEEPKPKISPIGVVKKEEPVVPRHVETDDSFNFTPNQLSKSRNSDPHNTHNSLIESIKQQVQMDFKNVDDMVPNDSSSVDSKSEPVQESIPASSNDYDGESRDVPVLEPAEPDNTLTLEDTAIPDSVVQGSGDVQSESNNAQPEEEKPDLDSKKLMELMEEDGAMEEKTREIKEKPKVTKSIDEYEESKIDLGDVFNVHK